MTETTVNKNLERRLRRAFHKLGYSLRKSRKCNYYTEFGWYMIVNDYLNCVAFNSGSYNYNLQDLVELLSELTSEE